MGCDLSLSLAVSPSDSSVGGPVSESAACQIVHHSPFH